MRVEMRCGMVDFLAGVYAGYLFAENDYGWAIALMAVALLGGIKITK